ncbi:Gfo/Idh/MocA family protein [Planctomicrobium sp. SH664]|uniref:Gfo/Idh/MocA family protein n=1 Tax=Planctomicrobium sp. SH664 TaxID=3448125 RepID=UPI003F5C5D82
MQTRKVLRFGIIGCGLMGREFASAASRWCHLLEMNVEPRIIAVCDPNPQATEWFLKNVPSVQRATTAYSELLDDDEIDVIYCAVPHHLHAQIYCDIIAAGKHLLGEKPFGIDQAANQEIQAAIAAHPNVVVRCASEMPFFPGAYQISQWIESGRFGRIIEVSSGFWHSSDLDPKKPINWKRMKEFNGEYGCLGDLGMHALHVPLRSGWQPANVRALLSNIMTERPGSNGQNVPCETWDNATLACEVDTGEQQFPMLISTKRIAPGHANTWFLEVYGTEFSARFSTQFPKQLWSLPYQSGGAQSWHVVDAPHKSAYPVITGGIFEFGFSDSILQMWAAFCDELHNGRDGMSQRFYCATPEEAAQTHTLFTAALESQATASTVSLNEGGVAAS